jgi:hypothetical protein
VPSIGRRRFREFHDVTMCRSNILHGWRLTIIVGKDDGEAYHRSSILRSRWFLIVCESD